MNINSYINKYDDYALKLRSTLLQKNKKKVLVANLSGSVEDKDEYCKMNSNGYGRIRIFKKFNLHLNNKPLLRGVVPCKGLIRSQVYQIAACNWRCWYCYVDYDLLGAYKEYGNYFSGDELISLYLSQPDPPNVIDLSGGQPDIVPEWTFWIMEAIERNGLKNEVYLWVDDNLSNNFLWRFLSKDQLKYMVGFPNFSRSACIKGFDNQSFQFNTNASHSGFDHQLYILKKIIELGFEVYVYVTLTSLPVFDIKNRIKCFLEKLIYINPMLPLRVIPLKISNFSNVEDRLKNKHRIAITYQFKVYEVWRNELENYYSNYLLEIPYEEIKLTK